MPIFFTRIKKISECHYYRDKLPLKSGSVIFCLFDWRLWGNFETFAGVKGMIGVFLPIAAVKRKNEGISNLQNVNINL